MQKRIIKNNTDESSLKGEKIAILLKNKIFE